MENSAKSLFYPGFVQQISPLNKSDCTFGNIVLKREMFTHKSETKQHTQIF
jgi:hypothetical protein